MSLQPSNTKYRKMFKGKMKGKAQSGNTVAFGSFGMKALDNARITAAQLESARRAIMKYINRQGKLWIRVFPDVPVSKKPAEVRMGRGKGGVEYWVARVSPGKVIFELDGVDSNIAEQAFKLASAKLPIATTFAEKGIISTRDKPALKGKG